MEVKPRSHRHKRKNYDRGGTVRNYAEMWKRRVWVIFPAAWRVGVGRRHWLGVETMEE